MYTDYSDELLRRNEICTLTSGGSQNQRTLNYICPYLGRYIQLGILSSNPHRLIQSLYNHSQSYIHHHYLYRTIDMLLALFNILCYIVGIYTLGMILQYLFSSLLLLFSTPFNLITRYGQNSWAVVTGASDGIGEGFCYELAKDGFNICLISRTESKLRKVEENIKKINPKVSTKVVVADFKRSSDEGFFDKLMDQIGDIDVSFLINNVGIKTLANFEEANTQDFIDQTVVNTFPMTFLTRRILPKMLQRPLRSGVINVSSLRGTIPFARMPGYSGTKKFNDIFSRSLAYEVESKVDVMSLRPMYVTSQMTHQIKGVHVITPEECARGAFNLLGKEKATNGHWKHRLQNIFIQSIPRFLVYKAQAKRTNRLMSLQKGSKNS